MEYVPGYLKCEKTRNPPRGDHRKVGRTPWESRDRDPYMLVARVGNLASDSVA